MLTKVRVCSVEGCVKPWYCRIFCLVRYGAWRRMTAEDRAAELAKLKPEAIRRRWEYENPGGEAELAAQAALLEAQNERLSKIEPGT